MPRENKARHVERIFLSAPYLNGREMAFIKRAIASNYIAPLGPQVEAFEKALCTYSNRRYALCVSSGTAAMHLALHTVGVRPGDVVIASTLTFIGSVSPVCFIGAEPVFVDSNADTWNMDHEILEEAIDELKRKGKHIAAVVPTDLYGQCSDYDAVGDVCAEAGIPLIIDAAESLGASYRNRPAGKGGQASILSFNGNKIITTSGGGALLTDDAAVVEYARKLSQQAREPFPHYEHHEIGYNYRMSNIIAAVGLGQMEDLSWRVEKKRALFNRYREILGAVPGIEFMPEAAYGKSSRWLSVCLVDRKSLGADREAIRLALEDHNIESRPVWKPMHLQPVFSGTRIFGGTVSEGLFEKGLCLPSGLDLTLEDQERICAIIKNCRK